MLNSISSRVLHSIGRASITCLLMVSSASFASSNSRIVASGGSATIEGSAGGGFVPWAVLSGYADEGQNGATLGLNYVATKDFSLYAARLVMFGLTSVMVRPARFEPNPRSVTRHFQAIWVEIVVSYRLRCRRISRLCRFLLLGRAHP